ncbi:MAG: hypothetical protein ACM3NF_04390 [Gemmatimonadota bacterium]
MKGKRFAVLVATVALAGALGGAASNLLATGRTAFADRQESARIVRAEKIEVVDANGRPRAWLEIDADGNPGLFLAREGCILASFSLVGNGKPRLDFGDNCSVRALLKVDDEGNPSLTLFDSSHRAIWGAP